LKPREEAMENKVAANIVVVAAVLALTWCPGFVRAELAGTAAQGRVAVTDPGELAGLGFPAGARNVFRLVAPPDAGEQTPISGGANGFGRNSHYFTVSALSFLPHTSAFTWQSMYGYDMYRTSASVSGTTAQYQLSLETGVLLKSVWINGYDYDGTENLFAAVLEVCQPILGGEPVVTVLDDGTSSGSAGYTAILLEFADRTVTHDCMYLIRVRFDVANSNIGLQSALVQWGRQIAPAPATATFTDVPTSHQMFAEIEALADSGITAGCTATTYCPTGYVTRAQMAAFFARALGLHYQ
jgi:hypothetical protein